jgi:hypothetical protein
MFQVLAIAVGLVSVAVFMLGINTFVKLYTRVPLIRGNCNPTGPLW